MKTVRILLPVLSLTVSLGVTPLSAQPKVPNVSAIEAKEKNADAADKAAAKAAAARKASEKAADTQKAAASQATVEKLNARTDAAAKAEAAQKASGQAAKATAKVPAETKVPVVNAKIVNEPKVPAATAAKIYETKSPGAEARLLNQPKDKKSAGEKGEPAVKVNAPTPRDIVAEREAKETAARKAAEQGSKPAVITAEEARLVRRDATRDTLTGLDIAPEVAEKLVKDSEDPEKAPAVKDRVKEVSGAAGDLQLVGVSEEKRKEIVDAVSRSEDPKGTANEKVGEAATEEVFGEDIAKLVPADKRAKFREVFQQLANLRGALETLGGDPKDPEVVEAVKESAQRGVTTKEEAREILERAAQKVLDRQGFSPAKPGEDITARLNRIADEQKAELAKVKKDLDLRKQVGAGKVAGTKTQPSQGTAAVSGAKQPRPSDAPQANNAVVRGGDGGGLSAGLESRFGRTPAASGVASSGGKNLGDGHGAANQAADRGGAAGSSGSGSGAGGNGGGSGGGGGSGTGDGSGRGPGSGGGGSGGTGGSGGAGGAGSGESGGSGDGDKKDGEGGGHSGGGTGDDSESHDGDKTSVDLSGDGMTMDTAKDEADATAKGLITPNPLDEGGGNPMELSNRTGGRLGGQEARNQQKAIGLAAGGGGAGGPNPEGNGSSGALLTPEEQANAARLIGVKRGGGVTNPNPLDDGGIAVTDRDLKDLHLKGTGGAKGPTDSTTPPKPQDAKSPLGGVPGIVAPGGGTRVNAQVPAAAVDASKVKVNVDASQVKEQVK